jgi:hypothetical protein
MEDPSKPPLTAERYEAIELAQYEIDKIYWRQLEPLRFGFNLSSMTEMMKGGPRPPRQPIYLCNILKEYACALFDAEVSWYPSSPQLAMWLRNLADRIETRIIETSLRATLYGTIEYHATKERMRAALQEALQHAIQKHLPQLDDTPAGSGTRIPGSVPPPQSADAANETLIDSRAKLLAEYKAATGNPSNYRIYNARNSRIHKPQFYQWRNGVLPRDSVTARHFEQFLRDKKPPTPKN